MGVAGLEIGITDLSPSVGEDGIVCSRNDICTGDGTVDGATPAVIVLRAEECLVDGTTDEGLGGDFVTVEHVVDGVRLALEPELIVSFDVVHDAIHGGLAGAVDESIGYGEDFGAYNGASFGLNLAGEEMVPSGESTVDCIRVRTHVGRVELAATLVLEARYGDRAEPTLIFISERLVGIGVRVTKVCAPGIQQVLQGSIECLPAKEIVGCTGVAKEVEDEIQRDTDRFPNDVAFVVLGYVEPRRRDNNYIHPVEQLVKVCDLSTEMSSVRKWQVKGIEMYLVLWRGLHKNLTPQVDHLRIGIDSSLELCDRFGMGGPGSETRRAAIDEILDEALVNRTIGWVPSTVARQSCLLRLRHCSVSGQEDVSECARSTVREQRTRCICSRDVVVGDTRLVVSVDAERTVPFLYRE